MREIEGGIAILQNWKFHNLLCSLALIIPLSNSSLRVEGRDELSANNSFPLM